MRRRELVYIAQSAITDAQWKIEAAVKEIKENKPKPNTNGDLGNNELPPMITQIVVSMLDVMIVGLNATRKAIVAATHCNKCNSCGEVYIPNCTLCKDPQEYHTACDIEDGIYVRCEDCNPIRKLHHLG